MRARTIAGGASAALIAAGLALAGCGSSSPRPASLAGSPSPIVLSAIVTGARVSVSPARVRAGPAQLTVANQATRAVSVVVYRARGGHRVARTAPIASQGSTQVSVRLAPGNYVVSLAVRPRRRTEAQRSVASPPTGPRAELHVGRSRGGAGGQLLAP